MAYDPSRAIPFILQSKPTWRDTLLMHRIDHMLYASCVIVLAGGIGLIITTGW